MRQEPDSGQTLSGTNYRIMVEAVQNAVIVTLTVGAFEI